jgi:hypothetical protein
MDLVMIRPPGIQPGGFVISPDSVWYARVLLLFSASVSTDTGSKSFDCALVSTLETYDDPENSNYFDFCNYDHYFTYVHYLYDLGWVSSVGSRIVYELDYRKPILYVLPVQNIIGKLPVVPVGDTGTIPHHLRNVFSGAPGDRKPGSGDGCRMWFINSWALGWSRDM